MNVPYRLVPSHQNENISVVFIAVERTGTMAPGHLNALPHVVIVLEPDPSCFTTRTYEPALRFVGLATVLPVPVSVTVAILDVAASHDIVPDESDKLVTDIVTVAKFVLAIENNVLDEPNAAFAVLYDGAICGETLFAESNAAFATVKIVLTLLPSGITTI